MALATVMTYNASQKRWFKKYRGKVYSVSCKQLGTPNTKEQSRLAANCWWERKQTEVDAAERAAVETPDHQAERRIERVLASLDEGDLLDIQDRAKAAEMLEKIRAWMANPEQAAKVVSMERDTGMMTELADTVHGGKAAPGRSLAEQIESWLMLLQISVRQNLMNPGRYDSYKRAIGKFRDWYGGEKAVEGITAAKLEEFWAFLQLRITEGEYSDAYCQGIFMTTKQFISRLAENGVIPLPGNIRSRRLVFSQPAKNIDRFTVEEVKQLLAVSEYSERARLYLLLALNCGMYQNDIAELGTKEVDWTHGTIKRVRSKMKNRKQAAEVTYLLWPETFRLLKKYRASSGDRVLISEEGNPLCRQWFEAGKIRRYDLIHESFRYMCKKAGIKKSIKYLRKTSSSELGQHTDYGKFAQYFLAQSPKSVADRHYVKPSDEQFFAAIRWLGERFGIAS